MAKGQILTCFQAGLRVHTYPEVLFKAVNLTANGGNCNPDKAPVERHISFGSASNILGDPEEVHLPLSVACGSRLYLRFTSQDLAFAYSDRSLSVAYLSSVPYAIALERDTFM